MTDSLADSRPRLALSMEQADAPVPKVVRRKRRHAGCDASALERGAEAVGAEAAEHRPLGGRVASRDARR